LDNAAKQVSPKPRDLNNLINAPICSHMSQPLAIGDLGLDKSAMIIPSINHSKLKRTQLDLTGLAR
jgi:hypothetical protein